MKIAVVGATGRTGQQVVEQELARGDDVIAVARHPETLPQSGPSMISAAADVLDRARLDDLTTALVDSLARPYLYRRIEYVAS